jgi:Flp pilus assembly protein TadD
MVLSMSLAVRSLATLTLPRSATRGISAVALFAAVQVADGIQTLAGVARFGPEMESNPILSLSMMTLGAGAALVIAKLAAVALATFLHFAHSHLTLALLTVFYVFAAVLPWTWMLSL